MIRNGNCKNKAAALPKSKLPPRAGNYVHKYTIPRFDVPAWNAVAVEERYWSKAEIADGLIHICFTHQK
jgi:hypothetical protein